MYLISACLAGQPVRYDGKGYQFDAIQTLIQQKLAITVCPEMLGGLACPREAAEISGGTALDVLAGTAKVITQKGTDVTEAFLCGAYKTLHLAQKHQIHAVVLKEHSPSCGRNSIYDGTFSGAKTAGSGVTAALLLQHGFQVMSELEFFESLK